MRVARLLLIATVFLYFHYAPARHARGEIENIKFDDTTPEAAIRTSYEAIASGDSQLALRVVTSPNEMMEWVAIQARTSIAFKKLGAAATKQFGDEGKSLQTSLPAEGVLRQLESVKPTIDGDTADWPLNPKAPLKIKQVEGRWKLDIHASFPSPSQLKLSADAHGRIADYIGQIATDIADGKFESIAEVREEMKRQRDAMNEDLANPKLALLRP